jgi:NADH dehydrogenase/NADH:ubiquinone oxidoreductase subunit G
MVRFFVDNKEIQAEEGTTLLKACLDKGIYIPNLCYLEEKSKPFASCRMCFVEIEGEDTPTASCTIKVREGMAVKTDTPSVRRLQRVAFQLLLSVHDVDCTHCPANKRCELQRIGKFLKIGLKPKHLKQFLKEPKIDRANSFLDYYPNRCVLCGKCIYVCQKQQGQPYLTFAKRGFDTVISSYREKDPSKLPCEKCMACVDICPVSAIILKDSYTQNQK